MSSKGKSDCKLKVKDPLQFSSSAPPLGTQTTDPAKVIKQAADGERCRHWQQQQGQAFVGPPAFWLANKTLVAALIFLAVSVAPPVRDALFSKVFGTRIQDSNTYLLSTIISTRALLLKLGILLFWVVYAWNLFQIKAYVVEPIKLP